MVAAEWPAYVTTSVMRQGYSEQDVDEREEFQPEKGPPLRWLSPSALTTRYQVTIRCTAAERAVLREFYRDRLGSGVLPFTRPDPATGETAEFIFATPLSWTEVALNLWDGSTTLLRMP